MKRILDDLTIFCAVVETGTLKGTSEKLSIPHSTVSRRIEALEKSLGLVLLHRTTRDVRVTSRGQELYNSCSQTLSNLQQSVNRAVDAEVQFKGKMKVSMPTKAGIDFLGSWLIDFALLHPELNLDISLSNDNKNLVTDEIDLAFRVGPLVDSSAIALHLWDIPYSLCAHESLLDELEISAESLNLEKLKQLPTVVSRPTMNWSFVDKQRKQIDFSPKASLLVDDLGLAYHAVKTAKYIGFLPTTIVTDEKIVKLKIDGLTPLTRVMYAYYLGRRHAQSQIKSLIDYIKQRYETQ